MTLNEFKKLQVYIEKIIKKLDDQAITEGVDITSPEYEQAILRLKAKIIAEKGMSFEEYSQIEQELNDGQELSESDIMVFPELAKKSKELRQQEKARIEQNIKDIQKEFIDNLTNVKATLLKQNKDDINKLSDRLLEKITEVRNIAQRAERNSNNVQKVVKTREIIKELDTKQLDGLQKDILELQKIVSESKTPDFEQEFHKIKNSLADAVNTHINMFNMPDFRKLALGLRSDIDSVIARLNSGAGVGDMTKAVYDPANIAEQLVGLTATQTLTNKRNTLRVSTAADATSISVNADSFDQVDQTNTQGAGTLTLNNPTGTPTDGQLLAYIIKCSNPQTLAFGNLFNFSSDLAQPSATSGSSKIDTLGFKYSTINSKWNCLAKNFGFA